MSAQKRGARPQSPGVAAREDVEAMIRVDHAGEYGAVRIYEGQLAVLDARGNTRAAATIRKMAEQEQHHLKTFDALINQRAVRPTALEPVWRMAGFALGAATALMGEKAAMACTAAVEEVIDQHYAAQVERLGRDEPLRATVEEFRADEVAHREEALAHGAEQAPGYRMLSETIKAGCRLAIKLSERI
ncbi:MAG TPA: demethoxyubiquinone hydroxylase family protein [Rhizomicrobium sp.]|jgi:ubiquinone biosynthesis monooxygenase Coq7|nr:demethoxyubiquinone hydroxylase family protein [Rhizomicrobium sp.]